MNTRRRTAARDFLDRELPHDERAEEGLIGAALIDSSVIDDVLPLVPSAESFHRVANGFVWDAIVTVYNRDGYVDSVTLLAELDSADALQVTGGQDRLADLVLAVPNPKAAIHYAKVVADRARLRRAILAAEASLEDAYTSDHADAAGTLERIERRTLDSVDEQATDGPSYACDLLASVEADMRDPVALSGVSTGYAAIDDMTGGLHAGELTIIAARPSMGKSALALDIARRAAAMGRIARGGDIRVPVLFFSLEMSAKSLVHRVWSSLSGVPMSRTRTGTISGDDWRDSETHRQSVAGLRILIHQTPGLTVDAFRSQLRREIRRSGIGLVIVDYLQLMRDPATARHGKRQEVDACSACLKKASIEHGIPVVALSQLSRANENREDKRPKMSDLRESGGIEQDADNIFMLHREEYYHKGDQSWHSSNPGIADVAELIIEKQRNGATGVVKLGWDRGRMSFTDQADEYNAHYEKENNL
jgi:replicative DNA helicase